MSKRHVWIAASWAAANEQARTDTLPAEETHAFQDIARTSMPFAVFVGVATTMSPMAALATARARVAHTPAPRLAKSSCAGFAPAPFAITAMCLRIGVPALPMRRFPSAFVCPVTVRVVPTVAAPEIVALVADTPASVVAPVTPRVVPTVAAPEIVALVADTPASVVAPVTLRVVPTDALPERVAFVADTAASVVAPVTFSV